MKRRAFITRAAAGKRNWEGHWRGFLPADALSACGLVNRTQRSLG
jgi:hypothetical protein